MRTADHVDTKGIEDQKKNGGPSLLEIRERWLESRGAHHTFTDEKEEGGTTRSDHSFPLKHTGEGPYG